MILYIASAFSACAVALIHLKNRYKYAEILTVTLVKRWQVTLRIMLLTLCFYGCVAKIWKSLVILWLQLTTAHFDVCMHVCVYVCYSYIIRISLLLHNTKGEARGLVLITMISHECLWYNWFISHYLWSQKYHMSFI